MNEGRDPGQARRAVGLTRAGMLWEEVARAFWPLGVAVAVVFAALAFGVTELVDTGPLLWGVGLVALLLIAALWVGVRRFRPPTLEDARARVDATLPGRPLSALRDHVAVGAGDAGSDALWRAHLAHMRDAAGGARVVVPDARLRWRDPVGLRLVGLIALVMALIFAPTGRLGQGIAALGATFRPAPEVGPAIPDAPTWEGWAEPPAYTRRPTIYLNALPPEQVMQLPQGTKLSFRLYGDGGAVTQDIGAATGNDPAAPQFLAERSGQITVSGRRLPVTVIPDAAPTVQPVVQPDRRADGRFIQPFRAQDDNGIVSGKALIRLDLAAIDRRFGLALDPEGRDDISIELPMPASGPRNDVRGQLATDLSRHPWANLPVTVSLEVRDGIDQQGQAQPVQMVLPGRRFFDPLAASLIELRRDLLWSRDNAPRSAEVLRAISWQPDGVMDADLAGGLRGVIGTLESGNLTEDTRNRLAQVLWDAAVQLEDGGLADALERMNQAQERLSEAIRNGASPDEVQRLMDELSKATDAYVDMLAQQGKEDPSQKFDRSKQQGQQVSGDQIQQMMDEIQRLMNEGRMAEAQELLEQFNRMMQNLRVTQTPGQGDGQGRPMDQLSDTLREQQKLADEAMRDLQNQWQQPGQQQGQQQGEGQQGQQQPGEGAQGQGQQEGQGQQGQSLADRQRALREDLGRQRGLLPGRGTEQGDQARRNMDDAGRAMEEAEQALRDGDQSGAMERQAQAIEDMREGMRALGNMAQDQQQDQQGQQDGQQPEGSQDGTQGQQGGPRRLTDRSPSTDPLGRATDGSGNSQSGGDSLAEGDRAGRARDLQDEIRRRSGEVQRPRDERDYLGRLLDNF